MGAAIEIREHASFGDEALVSAWTALEAAGACPSLFSSLTWVRAWAAEFGGELKPAVIVGRAGGEPVGVAPLFVGADGWAGFPVNFVSHRGELVVRDDLGGEFAAAVLARLRGQGRSARLRSVPRESPSFSELARQARSAGYLWEERPNRISPHIRITNTWEDYLASKPAKTVHEWERKGRRVEAAGDVSFHSGGEGVDLTALVDDFIAVEARSWKETRGSSIQGRGLERFYHTLTSTLAREGWFLPFWLTKGGRTIAFIYGAAYRGTYYPLKTSYDEEHAKLSPGVVIFQHAIEHAFRAGLAGFDFIGETARWKEEWANERREHVDVSLYATNARGLAAYGLEARLKPLARRIMGRA